MSESPDAAVVTVLTTTPDASTAESLAETLVAEHLVACANVIPQVRSIYRWLGEVRREDEVLLILKTVESAVGALESRLVTLHPYDMPELVVLPVRGGAAAYLDWVRSEVGAGS